MHADIHIIRSRVGRQAARNPRILDLGLIMVIPSHDSQSKLKTLHFKFVLKDTYHLTTETSVPERIGVARNSAEIP